MNRDIIYKHEAIDALLKLQERTVASDGILIGISTAQKEIESMSPVHIEALTDEEQRIFLVAMAREKAVCEKVDAEWSNENNNLVRICNKIERKVKAALWKI